VGISESRVRIRRRSMHLSEGYDGKSKKYFSGVNSCSRAPPHPLMGAVAR
jgi:hypothetical protein